MQKNITERSEAKKFYITTPIYYVNASPHLGHAYTTIAADILARVHRDKKEKTFFSVGTDEHGAKIEQKAQNQGKSPKEFVDEIANQYKKLWSKMNISNDAFIRTTDEKHIKAVQKALEYMYQKGDIYLDKYEGLYCTGCEQFKNEKDLVGGKCPDHQTVPEKMSEETYMFKMSKYADKLMELIESDEFEISPPEKKNEILSFYKEGLNDVSFSRKNVKWGIPLPWDKNHTAYVWSDAFLNYLTVLGWDGSGGKKPEMFPPDLQLIGKDILRVHATIWPAMLLSLDLPLPNQIFVHGFFKVNGEKMSKSLGNVISPEELLERYGLDSLRYLLITATPFGRDGDISWEKFDEKYNADLANGLGNLVARVSTLLEKNKIELSLNPGSDEILIDQFNLEIEKKALDEALNILWKKLREMDEFISSKAPWKMDNQDEIKKVLEVVAQNILNVADLLSSFMPSVSKKIIKQFTEKQIKKQESLFPRLNK